MDRLAAIDYMINNRRDDMIASFPTLWDTLVNNWSAAGSVDQGWMMYSANYLFRTQNVRWAIDPLILNSRVSQAPKIDALNDLNKLNFVLLTHSHKDHLDIKLLRTLRTLPIRWVVPEDLLPEVQEKAGIPTEQILIPKLLQPKVLFGLRITPFKGLHFEKTEDGKIIKNMPATAYLVESDEKRWLFPGDTRHYNPSSMPSFVNIDILFAHLWLGRGEALQPTPPLLNEFCNFCLSFHPRRIILTHLEEWGRQAKDLWRVEHANLVKESLKKLAPQTIVDIALIGEGFHLA